MSLLPSGRTLKAAARLRASNKEDDISRIPSLPGGRRGAGS